MSNERPRCSRCGGTGEFWCPETQEYVEPREEKACPDCDGSGWEPPRQRRLWIPIEV